MQLMPPELMPPELWGGGQGAARSPTTGRTKEEKRQDMKRALLP